MLFHYKSFLLNSRSVDLYNLNISYKKLILDSIILFVAAS